MKPFLQHIAEAKTNPYRYTGANPTVDLVVFRDTKIQGEGSMEILLIKRKAGGTEGGKWAIPGGFVNTTAKTGAEWKSGTTERISDAALRELEEETGLKITAGLRKNLISVGIYQGGGRDPRDNRKSWSISYAYTITIPNSMGKKVKGMDDAQQAKWFPVDKLPSPIAFDHEDIIKDAMAKAGMETTAKKERRASTQDVNLAYRKEQEGIETVFGAEKYSRDSNYTDFGHPNLNDASILSGSVKSDEKNIEVLRQQIWGVKQGGRMPDLWVYAPSIKPSKGLRYVNIKPLPREEMFSATHENLFPEMGKVEDEQVIQGRIDHDRKVISAVIGVWSKAKVRKISNSTIDRVFAELKKVYPGYRIFDQIGESRLLSFTAFITEANRGLTRRKNEWDTLTTTQVRGNRDVQQDIYNIINAAYGPIGGHPDFPSADTVPADNNITDIIDTDEPEDVDAAVLSKTTPFGKKMTTIASDGGQEAKREVLKKAVDILNTRGSYVEASGKLLDILVARGAPVVEDEATVRRVLKGKEIRWLGDGSYSRRIGGKEHTKQMLGKPNAG